MVGRIRRREDVDGRMRQVRARKGRTTERSRFRWWTVRRRSPEGRRVHRRWQSILLLLWLSAIGRRSNVLRLRWWRPNRVMVTRRHLLMVRKRWRRQPGWKIVPDPLGRSVSSRIKYGFEHQEFLAVFLADQGQRVDVFLELHPGIFCQKRKERNKIKTS